MRVEPRRLIVLGAGMLLICALSSGLIDMLQRAFAIAQSALAAILVGGAFFLLAGAAVIGGIYAIKVLLPWLTNPIEIKNWQQANRKIEIHIAERTQTIEKLKRINRRFSDSTHQH